jgi:hypothetical protein
MGAAFPLPDAERFGLHGAPKRPHGAGLEIGHGFTQAVHYEPRGLIGDAKVSMDFVRRNAVLV